MIRNTILLLGLAAAALAQETSMRACRGESGSAGAQATDAVAYWNEAAGRSIVTLGGKRPEQGLTEAAILHVAMYEAVNAICGSRFQPYAIALKVRNPALPEAGAAAAAHDVLAALYPDQRAELDEKYAAFLAAIPGRMLAKLNGMVAGQQAAAAILDLRAADGRNAGTPWTPPPPGPGIWQPTPPGNLPPSAPWVRAVKPWALSSPSQFRVPPPPTLGSELWMRDYAETKAYGGAVSSVRSPGQTDLAQFVGGAGVNPMLQWLGTWRGIAAERRLPILESARLFAMLSAAAADALIACWDSKYTYAFWRPVTAIRAGGGNPKLEADPEWIGLVVTPNHPEYPAAHGCLSGAVVQTYREYFGTGDLNFTMTSAAPGLMQPVRQYHSLEQALEDILDARIYGGMHYRNSTRAGAELGRQVANQVVGNFFLPREMPPGFPRLPD